MYSEIIESKTKKINKLAKMAEYNEDPWMAYKFVKELETEVAELKFMYGQLYNYTMERI